jgi:hypothetical protein
MECYGHAQQGGATVKHSSTLEFRMAYKVLDTAAELVVLWR